MKKHIQILFTLVLTLFIGASANAQCNYSLQLDDTYGDGWGTGELEVTYGSTVDTVTLATGLTNTISISVSTGDTINLNYLTQDFYNDEISFELFDPSGTSLYTTGVSSSGPSTGFHYGTAAVCPSCTAPSALVVTNLNATSADLGWTQTGSASTWDIEWDTAGFTATGSPTITGSTTNPHSITGLTANTTYEFYVRADCGGSGVSTWAGPFSFTTPCVAYSIPFSEGFESGYTHNTEVAGCISQESIAGTGKWTVNETFTTYNRAPRTGSFNAVVGYGNEDWMFFPVTLVSGTSYTADVYARQDGSLTSNSNVTIAYGNSNTAAAMTNTIVGSVGIDANYQLITGVFTPSSSGIYYIGIKGYMNSSPWYISLDDIAVYVSPSCLPISGINATNETTSGADLYWNEQGTATAWDLEIVTAGTTPSGTPTNALVSSDSLTISSLASATSYDYYVRANCGSAQSTWVGPFSFMTLCNAYSIPFAESFESGYTHNTEVAGCISQESVTGSGKWTVNETFTTYNRAPRTGSFNAVVGYGNEDWMFIPVTLVSGTSYTADVYARQDGSVTSNSNVTIAYGSSNTAASMTNTIVGPTGIDDNYQLITGVFTPSSSGVYYIGIKGYMNFSPWYISLDDIAVYLSPSCLPVSGLNATNETTSGADLYWNEQGTATAWDLEIVTAGTTPTGTPTNALVSSDSVTITSLASATSYDYYVRANCGSVQSTWVGPYSFSTTCNIVTSFPFLETFESTSTTIGCWSNIYVVGAGNWSLGSGAIGGSITSAFAGSQNALFVSASGTNSPTTKLASPIFDLTGVVNPGISFYYAQEEWAGDQNYTRLMYRTSSTGTWTEIWSDSSSVNSWTYQSVLLPNASATYQIAFEGINNYGYRNVIDEVTVKSMIDATSSVDSNVTCLGGSDGGATASATGGAVPYTYSWSNGATTASITGIAAGTYTVTVTDVNSESATASVTIIDGTQSPIVSLGNDTSICDGSSLTLDAGTFSSYSWDDASALQTRAVSYVLGTVNYSVTVEDADGCEGSDVITVTGFVMPTVHLGNDTTVCDGETFSLDAGTFSSYIWNDASTSQTRMTVSTLGAVDYSVVVMDANGCLAIDSVEITGAAAIVVNLGSDTSLCNGAAYTLDAGAGFTSYFWNNGTNMQTLDVSGTPVGTMTYSVTVEDAMGCVGTDEAIISTKAPVLVDLGLDTNIWADGVDTYTLDAGSGFTSYLWSDNVTTTQTYEVGRNTQGSISVIATNNEGCEGTDTVMVTFAPVSVGELTVTSLKMYPNPAVDQVTVELSNMENVGNVKVSFLTISGQVVMTQNIAVNGSSYMETFDVSNLATGSYLVQFEANGEVVVKQFVIK